MSHDSDVKRAVLQGIYEDNAGIPRSFTGKRRSADQPSAEPPPRRSHGARLYGTAGLLTLVVILGLTLRDIGQLEFSSEVSATTAETAALTHEGMPSASEALPPVVAPALGAQLTGDIRERVSIAPAATSGEYSEMLNGLSVPVADLFDLTVKTIVIDPGHGGSDPGAIGHQGLMEKDVALDIARRLQNKLVASGNYRVVLTRDDDTKVQLKDRVAFANSNDADLFISIHINSVPEEAGPVNYVETYFFGPHRDQKTLDLARKENQNSEYAMADFRQVIENIGDTLKTEESAHLAGSIHKHLYTNLRRHSTGLLDAGAKSGPFVVLLGVEVPSVLVEVSCISNEAESLRLGTPEYRESIATYLKTGIVDYLQARGPQQARNGVNLNDVAIK